LFAIQKLDCPPGLCYYLRTLSCPRSPRPERIPFGLPFWVFRIFFSFGFFPLGRPRKKCFLRGLARFEPPFFHLSGMRMCGAFWLLPLLSLAETPFFLFVDPFFVIFLARDLLSPKAKVKRLRVPFLPCFFFILSGGLLAFGLAFTPGLLGRPSSIVAFAAFRRFFFFQQGHFPGPSLPGAAKLLQPVPYELVPPTSSGFSYPLKFFVQIRFVPLGPPPSSYRTSLIIFLFLQCLPPPHDTLVMGGLF